jgi:hypothetical protein
MIDLKNIRDIIYQIFSDAGYSINNTNIQFPQPLDIKITKKDDEISLDFSNKVPKVSWKRLITLSAHVNGIALNETGGTIKLKYLPDISFTYDQTNKMLFNEYGCMDFSDIEQSIEEEFTDDARKNLASKCLQYGREWATIASRSDNFYQASYAQQRALKKQCKEFIKENIIREEEQKYGSAILAFILLYVLLPVVLKFIVERIFRKLFE